MGFADLREFIERVESIGELRRVSGADLDREIGAITEVAASSPSCPMVLFDGLKGCKPGCQVVVNLLHSQKRLAMGLGGSPDLVGVELVRRWKEGLEKLAQGPPHVEVNGGPVVENVVTGEDVNLLEFAPVKWHDQDGGRYFTGGVTVTRDPDDGFVNLGVYRLQIHDKSTLGLSMEPGKHGRLIADKYWSKGKSCPVAVSLGHVPALFIAGSLMAPWGLSEYRVAGHLNGAPIEVVPGRFSGLPVPAASEVVLDGEAPPPQVESRSEGPFGEAIGYYASEPTPKAVIKVKCIMFRNNPIIQGAPPMKPLPGREHFPVNYRCATVWNDLERCGIPDIRGVWQHSYGFMVVSLKQKYAGHATQALLIARGSRGSYNVRFIVAVDDDIDPCDFADVMWAVSTRCDPERDIRTVSEGWSTGIDPMVTSEQRARRDFTTPKVMINACKPLYRGETLPGVVAVSPEVRAEIMSKWGNAIK